MAVTMLAAVEFSKIPSLNFVAPIVTSDPAGLTAADEGRLIYNSTENAFKFCRDNGAGGFEWAASNTGSSAPTGPAGGDLTGTYPNPQIATGVIVDADVNSSAAIAQTKIATLTTDLAARLLLSGGTLTGYVTAHADPSSAMQLATKQYVDLTSQGFSFKSAVRMMANTNIASLSGNVAIDGLTTAPGDRVLLTAQTTASQNGIWVAAAGAWARAADMDASGELKDGTLVPVAAGTLGADSQYMCTAVGADPWIPGTSSSTWTRYSGLSDLLAGYGLVKSGTQIDIVAGDSTIGLSTDAIVVNSAPRWTTTRTISLTGDATGTANIDGTGNIAIATTVVSGGSAPKHFAGDVGAGTAVVITHNLNSRDVSVEVYRATTPWDSVVCDVERTSVNTVTLRFATAVGAAAYRCVVMGR